MHNNHVIAENEMGTARLSSNFNLVVEASASVAQSDPIIDNKKNWEVK